jgi:hypothetical protein
MKQYLNKYGLMEYNSGVRLPLPTKEPRTLQIESFAHGSGHTLICAEYGYPKGSQNTNS